MKRTGMSLLAGLNYNGSTLSVQYYAFSLNAWTGELQKFLLKKEKLVLLFLLFRFTNQYFSFFLKSRQAVSAAVFQNSALWTFPR